MKALLKKQSDIAPRETNIQNLSLSETETDRLHVSSHSNLISSWNHGGLDDKRKYSSGNAAYLNIFLDKLV